MTKIAQIDDHGSALAWSPVKDHADVVALGTKVRYMGTKQSDHGQKLKLKVPFGKQQVVAESVERWKNTGVSMRRRAREGIVSHYCGLLCVGILLWAVTAF